MINYSFTVKNNDKQLKPTMDDYYNWMENAQTKGFNVQSFNFEFDKSNRLHIHGIATAATNYYKLKVIYRSFHQKIDEIYTFNDFNIWYGYMNKEWVNRYSIEQKAITQQVQQTYPFL